MPKTHKRHINNSFTKGDLVEFIGIDYLGRGIGLVLEEVPYDGFFSDLNTNDADKQLSCVRVYWQNLDREETLHKARVKRIAEIVRLKKKK